MPRRLRKLLFWLHLVLGLASGVVIFSLCITGVLLTYELQISDWADRQLVSDAQGAEPLSLQRITGLIVKREGRLPASVSLGDDPGDPVEASFGRRDTVLFDPYTGEALGDGAEAVHGFFRFVMQWHRWFAMPGDSRELGKMLTGISNLIFIAIIISGLFLWWPRSWRWRNLKQVVLFRPRLRGRARDYNWHNVLGIWSLLPLLILAVTGAAISYHWVGDAIRWVVMAEQPENAGPRGGGRGGRGNRGGGESRQLPSAEELAERFAGLDRGFQVAADHSPGWQRIAVRLPRGPEAPLEFEVDRGHGRQPQLRSSLTLDRQTFEVAEQTGYADQPRASKVRGFIRFGHTGEIGGWIGQTIAGLASAAGAVLVYTGFALSYRRFFRRRRKPRAATA